MDIDKGFDLSCAEAFYREDYIEHKRGVKAASFAELIRALGEPLDDEELDMLAARVHEIICRRMSLGGLIMELKDTIELMTSDDYRERFKAEYFQLKIRIEKLSAMLKKWDAGELDFEPTCPKELLEEQCNHMDDYRIILERRARLEGIDLED